MKVVGSMLAAAVLNLCLITIAVAAGNGRYLSPVKTSFTLRGVLTVRGPDTYSEECRLNLKAVTSDGQDHRNAGSITGGSSVSRCKALTMQRLPWNIELTSKGGGIAKIDYSWCGHPEIVNFTISKRGVWSFSTVDACLFTGDLKSSPAIVVGE